MAVYRLLENLLGRLLYAWAKKPPKCTTCKAVMEKEGEPLLFLIPVFHGGDYTESAGYYERNCVLIHDKKEIPLGQRACRFWTLTCPQCGFQQILVEDFLQVRDDEVLEKQSLYDYADLNLIGMLRR